MSVRNMPAHRAAVFDFCKTHVGQEFHADDVRRHVIRTLGVTAPATADRRLRELRQDGWLGYTVLNARQSLYRVDWVYDEYDAPVAAIA